SQVLFYFSSRRRHTRFSRDWSSDVCSSDLRIAVDVIGHEFHPLKGKRLHLLEAAFFFFFSAGFISSKPRIKSSRSLAGLSARKMTLPFLNFFMTSTLLSQLPGLHFVNVDKFNYLSGFCRMKGISHSGVCVHIRI